MTGYTHHWNCRICDKRQESIDNPKVPVCDDCERPLATRLCYEQLGVKLSAPGIDVAYWMNEAHQLVEVIMKNWTPLHQRAGRRVLAEVQQEPAEV